MMQMSDSVRRKLSSRILMAHNAFVEIADYADEKGLKSILDKAETNAERLLGVARYLEALGTGYYGGLKLMKNPVGNNIFKRELVKLIEDTYEKRDTYNYPENKRWLNKILAKIKRLSPGVYPTQKIQNMLRDWRDHDPGDRNDIYWYLIIDRIADETGIGPQ